MKNRFHPNQPTALTSSLRYALVSSDIRRRLGRPVVAAGRKSLSRDCQHRDQEMHFNLQALSPLLPYDNNYCPLCLVVMMMMRD